MGSLLLAPLAKFSEFKLPLDSFSIFPRPVVEAFALPAPEPHEMVLRHISIYLNRRVL